MTREEAERNLEFADYVDHEVPEERFDMETWCGTKACLAGHWCIKHEPHTYDYSMLTGKTNLRNIRLVPEIAAKGMGLTIREADILFNPGVHYCSGAMVLSPVSKKEACNQLRELVYEYFPDLKPESTPTYVVDVKLSHGPEDSVLVACKI